MIKIHNILLFIFLLLTSIVQAQEFRSYTYFTNDSLSLSLDLFLPKNTTSLNTPQVIYVHGGGFANGDKTCSYNLTSHVVSRNIACAGAIMDINLITPEIQIPLMMFHGDAIPTVPYGIASHHYCPPDSPGWLMLFGSLPIVKRIQSLNGTCQFTTFKGGDHSIAGAYIYQTQQPVVDFINRVLSNEKFIIFQTMETSKT